MPSLCHSAGLPGWDANDRCSTTETFPGSNYFISNLAALTNFQSSAEQHQTLIDFVVLQESGGWCGRDGGEEGLCLGGHTSTWSR